MLGFKNYCWKSREITVSKLDDSSPRDLANILENLQDILREWKDLKKIKEKFSIIKKDNHKNDVKRARTKQNDNSNSSDKS